MLEGCRRFWSSWPESRMPFGSRHGSVRSSDLAMDHDHIRFGPMLSKRETVAVSVSGSETRPIEGMTGCNEPAILDGGLGLGVLADGGSRVANAATTKVDKLARLDP